MIMEICASEESRDGMNLEKKRNVPLQPSSASPSPLPTPLKRPPPHDPSPQPGFFFTDRSPETAGLRTDLTGYRKNRSNSNSNSKVPVQPVSQPVWSLNQSGLSGNRVGEQKNRRTPKYSFILYEINENFGLSYAHINVKDHTKATIYNHAYKYNSNKPCSLSGGPHFFFGLTSNARKVY